MRTHVPSERSLSEASAKSTPSLHTEINTPRTETEVQNRPVKKRKAPFGEFTELNQLFSNNLKKIRTVSVQLMLMSYSDLIPASLKPSSSIIKGLGK